MLDHHRALIYTMVIVSAADNELPEAELRIIGDIVGDLPIFRDFDQAELPRVLNDCTELIGRENGLEETLTAIKAALPAKLRETAYAIACDLVAADGEASQEELRILELIRHRLNLERLVAAAIERGARARFQTL
jgi:tellurite resistance protein